MKDIRWDLIAQAVTFYKMASWDYYELPWHIQESTHSLISQKTPHRTVDGCFVGSAEQSFVQLMIDGNLPTVHGMGVTPCLRDDTPGPLHKREFMKVELFCGGLREHFDTGSCIPLSWLEMILRSAKGFFYEIDTQKLRVEETEEGYDITSNGIEIGSYGIRRSEKYVWAYGTGLAEPRWSTAQKEMSY